MGMTGLNRIHLLFVCTAVSCWYLVVAPTITDVRLVNGSNNAEGRVEVEYDGSWGTVCSRYNWWDLLAARVVCRILGFDGALEAPGSARFGQGTGGIISVGCEGTEESLADYVRLVNGSNNAEGRVEVLDGGSWMTVCGANSNYWNLLEARVVCRMLGFDGALEAHAKFGQGTDVRLVNGSNDAEGRVEVLHDGSWGTICHYDWDLRDARVVCIMLGFDGALDAPRSARFGQGSGRILLTWVNCDGTEDNLADCGHRGIGDYSYCDIRLVNGSSNAEGRVEVLYGVSWMTVCDNYWNLLKARVVCRMRGFDGALEAPGSARFGQGTGDILYVWGCVGTEESLADCGHRTITSCRHHEDAGAVCYSGAHPNPFEVRLINGSNDAEGRVEVLHDGSWGTICHYGWDLRDVRVVCRMLGFDGALNAPTSARFGQGSGHILLAWVECDGTEDNLAQWTCGPQYILSPIQQQPDIHTLARLEEGFEE
eukprot:XP_011666468.1 PREDICTED: deleted in malignant brain tumors 1 protein-like [Strongylocentrotus purpuratus]